MIVSDYTKGLYHDKWIGGVLHYTGMGKSGDQDINWAQNATLAKCGSNGVDVDSEYAKYLVNKKKYSKFATQPKVEPQFIKHNPKSIVEIPSDILNKKIKHKTFGIGIISSIGNATIDIEFEKVGVKTLGYDFCMENNMIEFIE